jgi:hypothetical protein
MDRWADRAEVLASCGADGAWVFPAFRPFFGSATAEINKLLWWTPTAQREELLLSFANRIAGRKSGAALREAWKHVSNAIESSPELPPYYTGPTYLGPMHPMCANRQAALAPVFYGQYLFRAEHKDSEGLKKEPTFMLDPAGNAQVFGDYYAKMDQHLTIAHERIREANELVDDRHRLTFDAESIPIRWFHHTARTHSNFYKSCAKRESIAALLGKPTRSQQEIANGVEKIDEWKNILNDEKRNTEEARSLLEQDMRLDPYYGGDHTFSHGVEMIDAKLKLLNEEIRDYLPLLESQLTQ